MNNPSNNTYTQADISELLERIERAVWQKHSPWAGRRQAAAYCDCSLSTLDAAANEGKVRRKYRDCEPVFLKTDLDKWVTDKKSDKVSTREMERRVKG